VIVNRVIDLLAKRWGVPAKYLETFSIKEIINIIEKPQELAESLYERWEYSLFIPHMADSYKVICGKNKVDEFLYKNGNREYNKLKKQMVVTGQIAQPGKVRGYVKLLFGPQHNAKIKRGDILVSIATSPQLLPAMELAAAFITDGRRNYFACRYCGSGVKKALCCGYKNCHTNTARR